MRKRKMIEVSRIKDIINEKLAIPTITQPEKLALCTLLERILMDTGNYHGYNNLTWIQGGCHRWEMAGKPEGPAKYEFINEHGKTEYSRSYY